MNRNLMAVLAIGSLAACSSTPDAVQQSSSSAVQAAQPSARAGDAASSQARSAASGAHQTVGGAVAASAPRENSVYFDYDSTAVKPEYRPIVTGHARHLSGKGMAKVRVEGNTDDRGSREYNLALGQRRADALKQQLTLQGVPADRIETVSFGEEKPRAPDQSEEAYAQNRRADIVYATR